MSYFQCLKNTASCGGGRKAELVDLFGPGLWIHTRTATGAALAPIVEPPPSLPPLIAPEPPRERQLYVIFASVAVVAIIVGLWAWHAREGRRAETAGGTTISTAKVEQNSEKMAVLSPLDGLVVLNPNLSLRVAGGGSAPAGHPGGVQSETG